MCVFTTYLWTMLIEIKQVAQLSLTNLCNTLHHGKQQNFKTVTSSITTPLLWVICHPVARIDIAYLCTK